MTVHLHARSYYTLLDSTITITNLVTYSKKLGFSSVCCTDFNNLHGAMEFYNEAMKQSIKPIIGVEIAVHYNEKNIPFLLLAKNNDGFKRCMRLSTLSSKGFIDFSELQGASTDCFIIVYGEDGPFEKDIIHENKEQLMDGLRMLHDSLCDFDVAISMNDIPFWREKNEFLKKCCDELHIPTVAVHKIYYERKEDYRRYRMISSIRLGRKFRDNSFITLANRYILSNDEMLQLYGEECCRRSEEIASMCFIQFPVEVTTLPTFPLEKGSRVDYLKQLCLAGLKKRLQTTDVPVSYVSRLKMELDVIISMSFEDYFLIVYDVVRFARSSGILVGPGRGSSAGSLVAYCLGITHVDPLQFNLVFERFLNPERISMPDIDIDFPDNRRDEVFDYVKKKYGSSHVCHIVTYGTLAARQVLRDVGKSLEVNARELDMLCKNVPNTPKMTLEVAYKQSMTFKKYIDVNKSLQEVYQMALSLEGFPRHTSTHAAGVILSEKELVSVVPLLDDGQQNYVCQWSMEHLEQLGLIKMDFLGLRNLTMLNDIVCSINEQQPFDLSKISLEDKKTFSLIADGDTVGIFQLESDGMKSLLKRIKPSCFNDIVATIALYRPGPMENIPLYLQSKANFPKIHYYHDDLKPILMDTYGVIVYQEQIMQIAQKIAGFSLGKADILRKAMSKKNQKELDSLKSDFLKGSKEMGYGDKVPLELFELISKFAGYGFNKAHSVAYSLIAYQLAYLKANFPIPYYQALLNSSLQSEAKRDEVINECKERKVLILAPSISVSKDRFIIEKEGLRYPLNGIKNVGMSTVKEIMAEQERGVFENYFQCVARLSLRGIQRRVIESLIDAGAMDGFNHSRKTMLMSLDAAINYAELIRIETKDGPLIDESLVSKPIVQLASDTLMERCEREKNALGFYFSDHPTMLLKQQCNYTGKSLYELTKEEGYVEGFGIVSTIKNHRTKKGDMMAFLVLSDETASFDVVMMPQLYQRCINTLKKGQLVTFSGKMDKRGSCVLQKLVEVKVSGGNT